ncbi:MAG: hypothetical protein H7Y43_03030 [Akkermansiaceae bacterium]|nr:hypothetical protein [Verrucomicrobiales bacterium]
MNPVLLKELRQAMRSQFLIGMVVMLLILLFTVALFFLVRHDLLGSLTPSPQIGIRLLQAFLSILTVSSVLLIPAYIGIRLAVERRKHDLDLMFVTTLSPGQIVRGKLASGVYLTVMVFSVCTPFVSFTNLMRGVDAPTIVFILFCLFAAVCLSVQATIMFACLPLNLFFKTFAGMVLAVGLSALCATLLLFFSQLLQTGVGALAEKPRFWMNFVVTTFWTLCGIGLLQVISASLLVTTPLPRGCSKEPTANTADIPEPPAST